MIYFYWSIVMVNYPLIKLWILCLICLTNGQSITVHQWLWLMVHQWWINEANEWFMAAITELNEWLITMVNASLKAKFHGEPRADPANRIRVTMANSKAIGGGIAAVLFQSRGAATQGVDTGTQWWFDSQAFAMMAKSSKLSCLGQVRGEGIADTGGFWGL